MPSPVFSEEPIALLTQEFPDHTHNLASCVPSIDPSSPISSLDKLPREIVLQVLDLLDLQSICRLGQTCGWARHLVRDFQPYREILKHTPTFPFVLARTKLVSHHTARSVFRQVLCSDRCSSCGYFGVYVFLLTCERARWFCFRFKIDFHVVEASLAKSIFELSDDQCATFASYYCSLSKLAYFRTKDAEDAAINTHAPSSLFAALGLDKLFVGYCSRRIISTAAFVPLPSMDAEEPDRGRRCTACIVAVPAVWLQESMELVSIQRDRAQRRKALKAATRIYSKIEFLKHIKTCAAQKLLQGKK